nr:MAG TPA: hypothetical protein [Caudoviricetes sp.]
MLFSFPLYIANQEFFGGKCNKYTFPLKNQ